MNARRREIYACAAVQLRTHERAFAAERECPGAMGLYLFLLLDARGEGTDGDVSELVACSSWGGLPAYRKRQAEALLRAGLIERQGDRLVVVKYDEHNDTSASIEAAKAAKRDRMRALRALRASLSPPGADAVRSTEGARAPHVPSSISLSRSRSGSDLGDQDPPDRSPTARAPDGVVAADLAADLEVRRVWATQTQQREPGKPIADVWAGFCGHFAGQDFRSRQNLLGRWQKWIVDQCNFAAKERERERDRKDRRERGANPPPASLRQPTQAEAKAFAASLVDHIRAANNGGDPP